MSPSGTCPLVFAVQTVFCSVGERRVAGEGLFTQLEVLGANFFRYVHGLGTFMEVKVGDLYDQHPGHRA